MKRIRHILWTGTVAISAISCLFSASLWVRSYWEIYDLWYGGSQWVVGLGTQQPGRFGIAWARQSEVGFAQGFQFEHFSPWLYHHGNAYFEYNTGSTARTVIFSASLPVAIFAILPTAYIWSRFPRRESHDKPATCRKCGYDLRATPDRCPECGTVPPGEFTAR